MTRTTHPETLVEGKPAFTTRFAPSPTGRLHRGHAFSALSAWTAAEQAGGRFLLRIEDIDEGRCRPEFEAGIHQDLAWLGLDWERPVRRQSERLADYRSALEQLNRMGVLYRCFRTRKEALDEIGRAPHGPGEAARPGPLPPDEEAARLAEGRPFAWRLSVDRARERLGPAFERLSFTEEGSGPAGERGEIAAQPCLCGDVVLARKDVGVAYHLAVVHDDALQGVTHVVRGQDLFEATHVQRLLQALFGLPAPVYRHHPLLLGPDGKRLAKRDRAETLESLRARGVTPEALRAELGFEFLAGSRSPPAGGRQAAKRPEGGPRRSAEDDPKFNPAPGEPPRRADARLLPPEGGDLQKKALSARLRLRQTAAMTQTADRRALAALVFGACVIGLAPILARMTETGPAAAGFWRLSFAAPLLLLPAVGRPGELVAGRAWLWGLGAGVLFALDLGTWHYGVFLTSVTNATVLGNTTPVVVAITAWLLFRERPSRSFLLALVLAIGGAIGMGLAKGSGGRGSDPLLGDALALVAAVFYGLYFVVIRIARSRARASALMLWTTVSGAPVLFLIGLLMHERLVPSGSAGWWAGLGLGVMHVTGQGAIAWALGRLPATTTSVVMLLQPIVAGLLGWMLFGEKIVPLQALFAGVVLAGVVLAQRARPGEVASGSPARTRSSKGIWSFS